MKHDDVIKWKHFPRYWPFMRGIQRGPRTKARDAELWFFSLIFIWIDGCINNREAGDLRRYCAHYDVIVMRKRAFVTSYTILCICQDLPVPYNFSVVFVLKSMSTGHQVVARLRNGLIATEPESGKCFRFNFRSSTFHSLSCNSAYNIFHSQFIIQNSCKIVEKYLQPYPYVLSHQMLTLTIQGWIKKRGSTKFSPAIRTFPHFERKQN